MKPEDLVVLKRKLWRMGCPMILDRDDKGYSMESKLGHMLSKDIGLVITYDTRTHVPYNTCILTSSGTFGWIPSYDIEIVS